MDERQDALYRGLQIGRQGPVASVLGDHMHVAASLVAGAVVTAISVVGVQSPSAAAKDLDCVDFPSQQAAQLYFLNHNPAADPNNLDADGDGVVCESNPGPYYYGSNPNPGGNDNDNDPAPVTSTLAPIKVVKVLRGDLVRLRQGSAKPYNIRLIGLRVDGGCAANGARRYLKTIAKPGRVVTIRTDTTAPKRDGQGHLIAELRPRNGNAKSGFARRVVTAGWAKVQGYKFSNKKPWQRLMGSADYRREGLFGNCIKDYGSPRYPYRVGSTFEVDGWRYTFGVTDFDAQPEMTAEAAATPAGTYPPYAFSPPKPGATFRRVPVTATRIHGRAPQHPSFGYVYGDTHQGTRENTYGSCGTAPNQLDHMSVAPGETVSAYLCTAQPTAGGTDEMWVVGNPGTSIGLRYVTAS
jgi:endonuclease YncB( thermonuclease family)